MIDVDRKVAFILSLFVLLSILTYARFSPFKTKAINSYRVHNLDTGLNYTTIQGAIDANETLNGHTIFVENGVYFEHVVVNKSISLIGENRESTIVNGSNVGTVITIEANHTAIKNFLICNSGTNLGNVGIYLGFVRDARIEKNVITNTGGIYEIFSDNVAFNENVMNYNWYALCLMDSSNNNITANVMENNHYGISLDGCNSSILSNNTMNNNIYNFGILGDSLQDFIHHIDATNTINGCFIYYILNEKNVVINPSTFSKVGYIGIVNSTYVKVSHWDLSKNWCALLLAFANDSTITNVNITDNFHGIYLISSNNNTIENSRLAGNVYGLEQTTSNNTTVIANKFTENRDSIYVFSCNGSAFIENTIENSSYRGICLCYSNNDMIYHNNFIKNTIQVSPSITIANNWNDGYPSGGNYWSDYNGTDSDYDGIGDTPYFIDANNQDDYPLMGMFSSFNTSYGYAVDFVSNSAISEVSFDLSYTEAILAFNVSGESGSEGFLRVCIPKVLISSSYVIMFDGEIVTNTTYPQVRELSCSNETYEYLYINYTHSEHTITITGTTIIPEFPSFLIMPLFMIATLLAVIVYRRKHYLTTCNILFFLN
jgi:parallel beta-helix repeat protein